LVLKELEEQVFQTKNSIYRADGGVKRVTASLGAIKALQAGDSPDDWEILLDLKNQFPDSH